MARPKRFHVLVATDGSASAKAAVDTAVRFPWPDGAAASGIVVREVRADYRSSILLTALDQRATAVARATKRVLARRWPGAEVRVVEAGPAAAIVDEAARVSASVAVLGWRGHGTLRRLLTGSVSRGVARHAPCAVLTVKRRIRDLRQVVVGIDGSRYAHRAVDLIARLSVPRRGRVSLVAAVETMPVPAQSLIAAGTRSAVRAEVERINQDRQTRALKELDRAKAVLTRAGWRVDAVLTDGAPLRELLATVTRTEADLLAVGARGVRGLQRLLLGSVAEGALDRSPVPVLLVR